VAIQLSPANCKEFNIENYDTYIAFKGVRMVNPVEFEQALQYKDSIGFEDKFEPVSTFVRFVAKTGNCAVYVLNDNIRTNFFYKLQQEPLTELKFKMYFDNNQVNEIFEYRQQVNALFKSEIEKRKIDAHLEKLEYTEEAFSVLFDKLTPLQKRKVRVKNVGEGLVLSVGLSMNSFKVTGDKGIAEVNTKYKSSYAPLISIGYISPINRNFNRFFIYPHINLYNYKNTGEGDESPFKRKTTFKAALLVAPILNLGVNIINKDEYKYFVSGGGGILFVSNGIEETQRINPATNISYDGAKYKLSRMSYNINLSTGITIKNKIFGTLAYNFPASVANFNTYLAKHSSLQLSVGYKL
ncbi:MAG TPA: hypothetical protein VF623_02200, partial [Segetibacter sp.]